jgi:capsular exopolysaccharide synthesis family protein
LIAAAQEIGVPMERIKEALEKAHKQREQRQSVGGVIETQPRAATSSSHEMPQYSTTRVVDVDMNGLKERRVVTDLDSLELADSFRILRTQVMRQLSANQWTTLAIVSPGMGEGKTVVSANLAIRLAQFAHHTVLLVDLDFRRPGLHRLFGIETETGLADYLTAGTPLSDCLVHPGIEGLVLLPSGRPLSRSSETLSQSRMGELATELKSRYPNRLVVYDLPPLLLTDDALVFLKHVDACVLVVEAGATRKPDFARAIELLQGHNLIGTVLNKARSSAGGYAYS